MAMRSITVKKVDLSDEEIERFAKTAQIDAVITVSIDREDGTTTIQGF